MMLGQDGVPQAVLCLLPAWLGRTLSSPSAVCSSGKGAMTYSVCRELHRGLSVWNFWLADQWAGRHCTYFQPGFWVSWFASTILNTTGSIEVLHLHRQWLWQKYSRRYKTCSKVGYACVPFALWASQSTFERVALKTKAAALNKACGIHSFLLSNE